MNLTAVAQLLIGEALISPGGLVDADTVLDADPALWGVDATAPSTVCTPSEVLVTA